MMMSVSLKSRTRRVGLALGAALLSTQLSGQTTPAPLVGDVNGDGSVSAADALGVLNHTVGRTLPSGFTVSLTGDANGDGAITAADALVILSFAVGRDVSQFPVGQALDASVAVLRGAGVAGDPASGTLLMPRGRTVAYRFVLQPGFEELRVALDGAAVPDSGTVTASAAHLLVASASPVIVVPPADAPLVAEARAMLSAADPVVRYQALLDRMAALPPAEAERQLRLASGSALHGVRDSAAIRRLDEALAGRFFEVTGGQALRASFAAAGGESPVAGSLPSTLLYINGIHSDAFASMSTALRIAALAEERLGWTFGGGSAHRFGRFYNQTWADSPHGSGFQCLAWWQNGGWSVLEFAGMQDWYRRCLGEIDILEAAGQWIDVQFQRSGLLDADARRFAMRMQSEIRQGRSVLIVAHSQGNLMAQEALETLPASALQCVAVVSLAPPATDGWPDEKLAAHGSIFAKGQLTQDILLDLLYDPRRKVPAAELIETDTTRRSDAEINILAELFRGHRAYNPVIAAATLYNDLELHGADASYLAGDATRARTAALIGSSDNALKESCADSVAIAPRSSIVQVDSSITLTVNVFNPLGEELPDPRVEWRSANPSRATVDSEGQVTPLDTGRVWIRATHGEHARDSVAVDFIRRDSTPVPVDGGRRISTGGATTCALAPNGKAYCWGNSRMTGTGPRMVEDAPSPTEVAGGLVFTSISVGGMHTCGVTANGQAYCWAWNGSGQLGTGSSSALGTDAPALVAGGHTFTSIAAGFEHTCALDIRGRAFCWGRTGIGLSNVPVEVLGGHAFTSISSGNEYTCALTSSGAAFCWGDNHYGQGGRGNYSSSSQPVAVAGGHAFRSLSAGDKHVCALTSVGEAYCWGSHESASHPWEIGRLTLPTRVVHGDKFISIAAGYRHTCAVSTSGKTYCWGENSSGQLGTGSTRYESAPAPVAGSEVFVTVAAGYSSTCAMTAANQAYCWGSDEKGQLGNGTESRLPSTVPVRANGGLQFSLIVAGSRFTCGVATTGRGYCWGWNGSGELGNDTVVVGTGQTLPGLISTDRTLTKISAGPNYNCALSAAGDAYCWGFIGGETITRPRLVPGGYTFSSISAGSDHICALSRTGTAYCWGGNAEGQLGNGSFTPSATPTPVAGGGSFVAISAGGAHTCALSTSGQPYCWGWNRYGQLGTDSILDQWQAQYRIVPTPVKRGLTFASIHASSGFTCALTPAGRAYCWGETSGGRLGIDAGQIPTMPASVSGNMTFATMSTGGEHTCALTHPGEVYCWGTRTNGVIASRSLVPELTVSGLPFVSISASESSGLNAYTCALTAGGRAYCWGSNSWGARGDGASHFSTEWGPVPVFGGESFPPVSP